MAKIPFMPLYTSDYLGDTGHLSTEEHGAYMLLLMHMWNRGGTLPNDAKKLSRVARCSMKKWTSLWASLEDFFSIEGEDITSPRLAIERQKADSKIDLRRDAGAKGGRAKALNNREQGLAKATAKPYQPEPEPYITSASAARDARGVPDFEPDDRKKSVDKVLEISGPGMADPARSPSVTLSLASRIDAWLTAWDLDLDIIPVVQAKTEQPRQNPLRSYQILENDIAAHHARRMAAVPTVEIKDAEHNTISSQPRRSGRIIDPDDRSAIEDPFQRAVVGIVQAC